MRRVAVSTWFSAAGALAALAGSLAWLLLPVFTKTWHTHGGVVHHKSQTLLEHEGDFNAIWLIIPVLIAAWPFLGVQRWSVATKTAAALMFAFAVVTGFSIGYYYWPSVVLLLLAAVLPGEPEGGRGSAAGPSASRP